MSVKILLSVAAGGALGALGRFLVMSQVGHWLGGQFPYATLAVNLIGSFLLGAIVEVSALVWSPSPELRAFLVVGLLGAFTTFSTFSMDLIVLIERGNILSAALYATLSVVLCMAAFFVGMALFRHVFI
jgi:fluoride exporter